MKFSNPNIDQEAWIKSDGTILIGEDGDI